MKYPCWSLRCKHSEEFVPGILFSGILLEFHHFLMTILGEITYKWANSSTRTGLLSYETVLEIVTRMESMHPHSILRCGNWQYCQQNKSGDGCFHWFTVKLSREGFRLNYVRRFWFFFSRQTASKIDPSIFRLIPITKIVELCIIPLSQHLLHFAPPLFKYF